MKTPSVGRTVHYVAPGSADGTYPPAHRAAIVAEVVSEVLPKGVEPQHLLNLMVVNPTGIHFVTVPYDEEEKAPYTWHWPEYVPGGEG